MSLRIVYPFTTLALQIMLKRCGLLTQWKHANLHEGVLEVRMRHVEQASSNKWEHLMTGEPQAYVLCSGVVGLDPKF